MVDRALASARHSAAAAAEAEAAEQLAQARRVLDRMERVQTGVLAPSELEDARSRVAALTARHSALAAATREAAAQLGRHAVRAPFAGLVTARHVDPGDWVTPGQPVLDVVSVDAVEVRVSVSRELAAHATAGDSVKIKGEGEVSGLVAGIVPALDPGSRTGLVRVTPSEPAPWLVPGVAVQVTFPVERGADGTVVPRDALVLGPAGNRVVRVVDGKAEPVDVQVVASTPDAALVTGVDVGDTVVIRGNERLRPGQAVTTGGSGP